MSIKQNLLSVAHRGGRLEPFSSHLTLHRAQKVYSSASVRVLVCALVCVCLQAHSLHLFLLCSLALSL